VAARRIEHGGSFDNPSSVVSGRLHSSRSMQWSSSPIVWPVFLSNAWDRLDGVADGIIDDPRRCHFDPATIVCPYPQVARWKGVGSTDEAANFDCVKEP
jgi:hypothetical protein